jgi:hypothetical protein
MNWGYLGSCENEREVVVEIRELRVVLELLPNLGLVRGGSVVRNLLLQQATDLSEPLLLGLP